MKPLYVKKNGVVYKISGTGIPSIYPAANVEYDNTVTSELQATDVQGAIDELSTREAGVQSDWNEDDTTELDYIKNKPQNLVQDASYVHTDNNYDATAKDKVDSLGTASTKDAGVANGVAELDAAGKVPSSQLPSFVDDVIEVADYDHLPITGESGKIYVTIDTNKSYRWTGSGYAEISESLALGETSSTAYRGDRGKTAYDHSQDTGRITTAVSSGLYKFSATAQGHISGTTAVQKSDITALGIPAQDTTYNDATTSVSGLMSANDKTKLDNIAVARFGNTADSQSKKIKIKINNESRWMLAFTVTLYKDYKATKVMISGYNFTSYWHRPAAVILGKSYDDNVNVYFGYDSLNNLWVGFDGGSYKGVSISDVANGFQQISNYDGLFTISEVDTLTTLQTTLVATSTTRVESSTTNGNIKIDSVETPVYRNYGNNTVLTTDKTPFLTRQTLNPTGFSGYVREKLIGASYAWNQLVENGDISNPSATGWSASNATVNSVQGLIKFTASAQDGYIVNQKNGGYVHGLDTSNHIVLISCKVKLTSATTNVVFSTWGTPQFFGTLNVYTQAITSWQSLFLLIKTNGTTNWNIALRDARSSGWDEVQATDFQIIDLTLAFGSTIADYLYGLSDNGSITKLRDMGCPIDKYTPYGNYLVSSKTSGKKIVGKNLFGGVYDVVYPLFIPKGTVVTASINYHGTPFSRVVYFDKNGNTIDYWSVGATSAVSASRHRRTFTILEDAYSFKFTAAPCEDMQIEIGEDDTTYEPYIGITYPLGNDELRGKFDLVNGEIVASGDVKESNGNLTRNYGIYTFTGDEGGTVFTTYFAYSNLPSTLGIKTNTIKIISSNGLTPLRSGVAETAMSVSVGGALNININNVGADVKAAMAGKTIIFEKATPTTEQSTPFADPMSMVGATTEEYIDEREIPCPVGAERQYMGQSEDVVEIPSSPQSDGKRVLISEVSGGKEQVYWDIPKLYYKEYTVQGDGTKTYGDLLAELKPYYEALSEDEKTYSKVMMRATSSGNECLTFVGNYWYSRMGVNASGLWLDQIDFQYNRYFKQVSGGSITEETNTITHNVIALRVLTYTRAES